jgi:hypothetical protein
MKFNPARICAVLLFTCGLVLVSVSWGWCQPVKILTGYGGTSDGTTPGNTSGGTRFPPPPPPREYRPIVRPEPPPNVPAPGETATTPTPSPQSDYQPPYVRPTSPKPRPPVVAKPLPPPPEEEEVPRVRVLRKKRPRATVHRPKPRVVHLGHPHRGITHLTDAPPRLEFTDPSAGPVIAVPKLLGYSREQALEILRGVKLQIKPLAKKNPNLKAGIVFEQDPPPGALVPPYTLVTFTMAETVPGKGWLWAAILGALLILLAGGYHLAKHLWRPTIRITPKTDMGFQQFAFEPSGSGHFNPDVGLKLWMDPGTQRIEKTGLLLEEDQ